MFYNLLEGEATAAGGGSLMMIISLVIMFGAMWLFIIRPQKKKQKEEEKMRNDIQIGDEIVTIGGIYGRVISLKEDTIVIESVSDRSKITIARWALQSNLTVHDDTPVK
jgi:preprotein translocase subunit YajC